MREGKKEEKTGNGNRNKKKNFEKLDTKKVRKFIMAERLWGEVLRKSLRFKK